MDFLNLLESLNLLVLSSNLIFLSMLYNKCIGVLKLWNNTYSYLIDWLSIGDYLKYYDSKVF